MTRPPKKTDSTVIPSVDLKTITPQQLTALVYQLVNHTPKDVAQSANQALRDEKIYPERSVGERIRYVKRGIAADFIFNCTDARWNKPKKKASVKGADGSRKTTLLYRVGDNPVYALRIATPEGEITSGKNPHSGLDLKKLEISGRVGVLLRRPNKTAKRESTTQEFYEIEPAPLGAEMRERSIETSIYCLKGAYNIVRTVHGAQKAQRAYDAFLKEVSKPEVP